jgi:RNA polymerase sigma factor for flagellar operon FliA
MIPSHMPKEDLINLYLADRSMELRDSMIVDHTSLVHFVLGRMSISPEMGTDYEDLVSQGLLGLIEAVDRYDPKYGAKFSSYAILRIRGKILDYLRSTDWLSRGARQRAKLVQDAFSELWMKLQREPSNEEIAEYLETDIEQVKQAMVDNTRIMVSFDDMVDGNQDDPFSLHEVLADEKQLDPSDIIDNQSMKESLVEVLTELTEREQQILSLYYYEELTFKEIGKILEVSESRISQLHGRILMKIKTLLVTPSQI